MSEDVSQLLDKALELNESGAVEEAYEIFRKVTTSIYASAVANQKYPHEIFPQIYDFIIAMSPTLLAMEKADEVEAAFTKSFDLHDAEKNPRDVEVMGLKYEYYYFLIDTGRIKEALEGLSQLVIDRSEVQGKSHPETLEARRLYSVCLFLLERYEEATPLAEEIIQEYTQIYGEDYFRIFELKSMLLTDPSSSDLDEEIKQLEEMLEEQKRALGPDDLDVIVTHLNLGLRYFDAHRYDDSLRILEEAIKLINRNFPKGDPMSAQMLDVSQSVIDEINNLRK